MSNEKNNSSAKNQAPKTGAPVPVGRQNAGVKAATTPRASLSNNGVKGQETSLTGDAMKVKEIMEKEPKVQIYIPLGIGEKAGAYETVSINGYKWTIQKGVTVMVPQPVATILYEYMGIQNNIGLEKRIDLLDNEKAVNALD